MLGPLPEDFRYVLGLQEAVAVGMADGFAQASGKVAHVNLHTAPGVGNGVGRDLQRARQPRAAARDRRPADALADHDAGQPHQPRRRSRCPKPYVKYSHEPPRAADVPFALAQAIHNAALPPAGPAFVSIPMDDWLRGDRAGRLRDARLARTIGGRAQPRTRGRSRRSPRACARRGAPCSSPAPTSTPRPEAGTRRSSSSSPSACPCGPRPPTNGSRIGFPEGHPAFQGMLPPAVAPLGAGAGRLRPRARRGLLGIPLLPEHPRRTSWPRAPSSSRSPATPTRPRARRWARRSSRTSGSRCRRWSNELSEPADREQPPPRARARAVPARAISSPAAKSTPCSPSCSRDDGDRRARVALEHRRRCATSCASRSPAPTTSAPSGGLGFGLAGRGRRAARPARAPGRLRARRGLRAVRDHRLLDRRRLRGARQVPRPAQPRVLDPQVVRELEDVSGAPGARPARARRRRDRRRATACPRARVRDRARRVGRCTPRSARPSRRRGRASCRSTSPPGWRSFECVRAAARPRDAAHRQSARPRVARPRARLRSPPARRSRCAMSSIALLGADRVLHRAIDLIALRLGREPLPPPARGRRDGPRRRRRREDDRLRAQRRPAGELPRRRHEPQRPGPDRRDHDRRAPLVLARARSKKTARARGSGPARCSASPTALLARHGHKLGPDPASKDIATVGGVIANNSGGMRCGVEWDSYSTVESHDARARLGRGDRHRGPGRRGALRGRPSPSSARGLVELRDGAARRRGARGAGAPQVRDQERHRLPAVRAARRRDAARDLPPPRRRLGGDARVHRRGRDAHAPRAGAHDARLGPLRGHRRRRRSRSRRSSPRARAPPS